MEPVHSHRVKPAVMLQGWRRITFLHWRYQPEAIRKLLPSGIELDTFDGSAWIGLTPFLLTGLRPPSCPSFPWISRFPEMNVRTYVRGPDGEPGIWFFTLEAARLFAVAGSRLTYGLPYRWARMRIRFTPGRVEYRSRRRLGAGSAYVVIEPGPPVVKNEQTFFLTERYRLYTKLAGRLAFAAVEHVPWPLYSAHVARLHQTVIENSGVPGPVGEPLVHYSPGVSVRVGRPKLVR